MCRRSYTIFLFPKLWSKIKFNNLTNTSHIRQPLCNNCLECETKRSQFLVATIADVVAIVVLITPKATFLVIISTIRSREGYVASDGGKRAPAHSALGNTVCTTAHGWTRRTHRRRLTGKQDVRE